MLATLLFILQATTTAASAASTVGAVENSPIVISSLPFEHHSATVSTSPSFIEKLLSTKNNIRYLRSRKDAPAVGSTTNTFVYSDSEERLDEQEHHHRLLPHSNGLLNSATEVDGIVNKGSPGTSLTLSIDGKTVYSAEYKRFSAMDVVTGKKVYTDFGDSWNYVILSHTTDPDILFIGDALVLQKYRLSTGETRVVYDGKIGFEYKTICMKKDGSTIFWSNAREVQMMDVATELVTVLKSYEDIGMGIMKDLQLSHDDSEMYMTAELYGPCKIYRIRTSDGEVLGELVDMKIRIFGMTIDYKRNLLYVGGYDTFMYQVDIATGEVAVLAGGGTQDEGAGNALELNDNMKFTVLVPALDLLMINELPMLTEPKLFILKLGQLYPSGAEPH